MFKKYGRYIACAALLLVFLAVYELRLFQWQIVDSSAYTKQSEDSSNYYITLDAARGEILDRNGNILAGNRTTFDVVMNALTMDQDRNPAILSTIRILEQNAVEWIDRLPIVMDANGVYSFESDKESEIAALKSASMLNMQDYATAEECMNALTERYNCQNYPPEDAIDIISVRYNMTRQQFSTSDPYVIADDVPIDVVAVIDQASGELPGVETVVSTIRDYDDGTTAPQAIGTLGSISQEQYNSFAEEGNTYSSENPGGYSYSDILGQSGLERVYESELRGTNGRKAIITDSDGNVISETVTETPQDGNTVHTTMDVALQRTANASLAKNIQENPTADCTAGAAVVLDVKTFGVLAAASYPSYDLTKYLEDEDYYYDLLADETTPLFDRSLDGTFTPGSTMKPIVAAAALEENIIDTSSTVYCDGVYRYFDDYQPTCMGTHGDVNVFGAIEHSCNVFFYDVGRRLTIDKMGVYASLFSFGEKTGVEVGEASGIMSGPEEYLYYHGTEWADGLTVQAAIGQGDTMVTPIQLAAYCATIANDGVRMKTHFLDHITDYDGGKTLLDYEPEVAVNTGISQETMTDVQEAMALVTDPEGTAGATFGSYGVKIAAKTGTAENPNHSDNTVFVAYAPYDDPEIAVAVVLEYGAKGTYSQAVAKDIFDQYFYGTSSVSEAAGLSAPEETDSSEGSESSESSDSSEASSSSESEESIESESSPAQRGDDIPDVNISYVPSGRGKNELEGA